MLIVDGHHCYLIKNLLPHLSAISREGREKVLDGLLAALSCFIFRFFFKNEQQAYM
jgi:hypothetical protein